jgi:hypothetical protein
MRTNIPILSQIGPFCDKKNAIHPRLNDSGLRALSLEVGEFWLVFVKRNPSHYKVMFTELETYFFQAVQKKLIAPWISTTALISSFVM